VTQVGHLLLAPVAAPADHVHRDPALVERALEQPHGGGGSEQHHDVAVGPRPASSELVHVLRQQAGLRRAPRGSAMERLAEGITPLGELLPGVTAPVDHEQVHARLDRRWRLTRSRGLAERLEALAPGALEGEVDGVQQLAAGAEVHGDALGAPGL
jgi:hypothetical protein